MKEEQKMTDTVRTRVIDGAAEPGKAVAFYRRYRRLYVGDDMALALLDLDDGWRTDRIRALARFGEKRQKWEQGGGYVENLSLDEVFAWLASGSCLIAEVAAPEARADQEFVAVAQRMLRVPVDDWAIPLLTEPADEIADPVRYRRVVDAGWKSAAFADYWGVLPEWNGKGLAGQARYAAMRALMDRNSRLSQNDQVTSLVGMAFALQGVDVLDPDGDTVVRAIRLRDFGQDEVANRSSLRGNTLSKRTPAHIVGKHRPAAGIPIVLDGARYALHVDWYYYAHFLDEVAPAGR